MRHQEPDQVPLFYRDVPEVDQRLQKELGLKNRDELLSFFDIDFRWVEPRYVGPSLECGPGRIRDIWHVEYKYLQAGHGGYWNVVKPPLIDAEDLAALEDYPWPTVDQFDFSVLDEQLQQYQDYAIMTAPGYASPGPLTTMQNLLGIERAWTEMLINQKFYEKLLEKIQEFVLPFMEKFLAEAQDKIDFFRIGDDFGTQQGLLMRKEHWRKYIQPHLKPMNEIIKRHGAYYYHHSCGAIRDLIPDMIAIGLDVIDPVQVGAAAMIPAELKAQFGSRLCFSGGVDEQELLPKGTPQNVKKGVHKLLDDMARGGGFFVGPTHNFQADIPTENIIAMYEAARQWKY